METKRQEEDKVKDMKDDGVLERLREVMQQEKNPNAAAARWGVDGSSLAKQLRGERGVSVTTLQAVLAARDDVDAEWLLTGRTGRTRHARHGGRDDGHGGDGGRDGRSGGDGRGGRCGGGVSLPLIPMEAVAGVPGDDWMEGVRAEDCEHYDVPGLEGRGAELLVRVCGNSMCPTLNDGDVMAVRRLRDRSELSWGRMYVIDSERGALVKRLMPAGDREHVLCRSDNPHYADFTLPLADIRSVWDVVGLIHGV